MRVLRAAAVIALLTAPAYAQAPHVNLMPEATSKTPEEKEADEARDKAYKESLKKIPDAKTPADPWGNVRGRSPQDGGQAENQKPAAPRTRTLQAVRPPTGPATFCNAPRRDGALPWVAARARPIIAVRGDSDWRQQALY